MRHSQCVLQSPEVLKGAAWFQAIHDELKSIKYHEIARTRTISRNWRFQAVPSLSLDNRVQLTFNAITSQSKSTVALATNRFNDPQLVKEEVLRTLE
jgi:hypothetical protein